MKKIVWILILISSLFSCNKKKVKVPLVPMNGEEKVANNSAIWFFYDNGKLDLNEHNRISSTNWLFNIDKKLSIKDVFPEVIRLFDKHHEKSPHNTKPMKNYFTYVNTLNKHLSFYNFDSIHYVLVKPNALKITSKDTLFIAVKSSETKFPSPLDSVQIIQPIFSGNMNFQDYLSAKAKLKEYPLKDKLSSTEYIEID